MLARNSHAREGRHREEEEPSVEDASARNVNDKTPTKPSGNNPRFSKIPITQTTEMCDLDDEFCKEEGEEGEQSEEDEEGDEEMTEDEGSDIEEEMSDRDV
ncbi:hypothetical protein N7501_010478 [Penicillium viridicatum]|nr:hypothetical protein N7501_010478 [Penicillium viridicatum]